MISEKEVQHYLATLVAQAMYMDEGEIDENELFSNFGLESVTLVKLVAKINEKYSTSIGPKEFLTHQTLRDSSRFVFQQISASEPGGHAR
jgi:acyl carrier protein